MEKWKEHIPDLISGYEAKNVFNMDETGLFFHALPTQSHIQQGQECNGGKTAKDRLSISFCASATGEKLAPIVIWHSENPCCYKGVNQSSLGVQFIQELQRLDDNRNVSNKALKH